MITKEERILIKLERVFPEEQASILTEVITDAYSELVKTSDFNELKEIVRELAEAQKRSEDRLTRVEIAVEELAEAQKRSEDRLTRVEIAVEELAEAQKRTEIEIQSLTKGLKLTRGDLGGLSRSMCYAFENEAYRMLPSVLKNNYGIEMTEKMVRRNVGGREINVFGRARLNGKNVLVIGEARLRLEKKRNEKKDVFKELDEKIITVKKEYKEEIIKILITHYAEPEFIEKAKKNNIILIQSFEW